MALIVFSFPHGFPAARDIRKRSEVQHISPLILFVPASSVKHRGWEGESQRNIASKNQTRKKRVWWLLFRDFIHKVENDERSISDLFLMYNMLNIVYFENHVKFYMIKMI